jgi:hypothetical protein
VSKFQIQNFKKKKKIEYEIDFEIKKNHISVSVLTTPVNFWSMTDRTPVFHLDTFQRLKKKVNSFKIPQADLIPA